MSSSSISFQRIKAALNQVHQGVSSEMHLRRILKRGKILFEFISRIQWPLSEAKFPKAATDEKVKSSSSDSTLWTSIFMTRLNVSYVVSTLLSCSYTDKYITHSRASIFTVFFSECKQLTINPIASWGTGP